MTHPTIPAGGLPIKTPGAFDSVVGVDESTGNPRRFPGAGLGAIVGFTQAGTGAVSRAIEDKLRDEVSARDFGAAGDGISDDAASINSGLSAAVGRSLRLVPGRTYRINSAILIPSNTTLDARGATILRGASIDNMVRNTQDGVTGGYAAAENVAVIGGRWVGNSAAYPSAFTCMAFGHATGVLVRDAVIEQVASYHHIELNGVDFVDVSGCTFLGGAEQATDNVEAIQIDANFGTGQWLWEGPADSTPCNNISIHHCKFKDVGAAIGSHSSVTGVSHTNINISDNVISGVYYLGIRTRNWSHVTISRNRIVGGYGAILVQSAGGTKTTNVKIENNTISGVGVTSRAGTGAQAVQITGVLPNDITENFSVTGNLIIDTNVSGKTSHALSTTHAKFGVISGNVVRNVSMNGIYVFGGERINVFGNTVVNANIDGFSWFYGIAIGSSTAGQTSRVNVFGNTADKMFIQNSDRVICRNNIAATSITTGGTNTNVTVSENLIDATFA